MSEKKINMESTEDREEKLEFTDEQKRKLRFYKILLPVMLVIIVVLVVLRWFIGGWWLDWVKDEDRIGYSGQGTKTTDFVAPPHDASAVKGLPSPDEKLGWSVLEVQKGYIVHVCGVLNAEGGSLPIWFSSDSDNTVWVKLRIIDADGNRLGETGILYPGEYVENIKISDNAKSGKVTLQVLGYEPETYYSAGSVGLETTLSVSGQ